MAGADMHRSEERVVSSLDAFREKKSKQSGSAGGEPPNDMEPRVKALEGQMDKVLSKLDDISKSIADGRLENEKRFGAIEGRLTGIEKTLDSKAAKTDLTPIETKLGAVDGKVSNLPGTPTLITLVLSTVALCLGGTAGLAFALFKLFGKP